MCLYILYRDPFNFRFLPRFSRHYDPSSTEITRCQFQDI